MYGHNLVPILFYSILGQFGLTLLPPTPIDITFSDSVGVLRHKQKIGGGAVGRAQFAHPSAHQSELQI